MKNKSKLIGYLIGGILFVIFIAGVSYAMYRKTLYNVDVDAIAKNLDEYIIYSKGVNISSGTLMPVSNYTGGTSATVTFYKKDNTYDIYGHIYLDINSITVPLSRELRYTVIDNSTSNIISEGSFYTYMSGDSILTAYNIPLSTSVSTYTIYIWLDEELYDLETASSSFDIDIRCYATMNTIDNDATINVNVPSVNTAANFVNYLYDSHSKSTATLNTITYNLAPSVGLMNDRLGGTTNSLDGGDIRYYGVNPNNYVWLGDTYTSQFSSNRLDGYYKTWRVDNKKLWRIIGVFDGRLKLVSDAPISTTELSWDTSPNSTGGNGGYGINQWGESTYSDTGNVYKGADLMRLLNPGFEDNEDLNSSNTLITVNNSLYWNKGTGTVYTSLKNGTTSNVSFVNTGLSASERDMIDTATWYFGLYNYRYGDYADVHYASERQDNLLAKTCTGGTYCNDTVVRTPTWNGKVGLMYASDIGYANDLSLCTVKLNGNCTKKYTWISSGYTISLCTGGSVTTNNANSVFWASSTSANTSNLTYYFVGGSRAVYPSIYLKPNVVITEGNGTEDNPYVLSLG